MKKRKELEQELGNAQGTEHPQSGFGPSPMEQIETLINSIYVPKPVDLSPVEQLETLINSIKN